MQHVFMTLDELEAYSYRLAERIITSLPKPEHTATIPEFMNYLQACDYLGGISKPTLNKIVKDGKIVPVKPSPDRIAFYKEDLKNYLLATKKAA